MFASCENSPLTGVSSISRGQIAFSTMSSLPGSWNTRQLERHSWTRAAVLHLWLCSAAHPAPESNSSIMEETNWNRSTGIWEKLLEGNFILYFKFKKKKKQQPQPL